MPFFLFNAENDAANSGKLVPIATRVSPITVLDTPKAMDSYRNKAKYSKDRATNSAVATILRKGDH